MTESAAVKRVCELASALLGPVELVADHSWPHAESVVIEVRTRDHRSVIVKRARRQHKFEAELRAYRRWVPALGANAPERIAHDVAGRTLVLSKLPGDPHRRSASVFRRAGRLLRRFHGAEPGVQLVGFADEQRSRLDEWVVRARPDTLGVDEIDFVSEQIDSLTALPDPVAVPCHRDWHPRNWLTAGDGSVAVIDFEHARFAPWTEDLQRLWWDDWRQAGELASAFFDGYGARLSSTDRHRLVAVSSLGLLSSIVWADEHSDRAFARTSRQRLRLAMSGAPDPI